MSVRDAAAELATRAGIRHMRIAHRWGMLAASIRAGSVERGGVAVLELSALALRLDVVEAAIDGGSLGLRRGAEALVVAAAGARRAASMLHELARGAVGAWHARPERTDS